MWNIAFSTESRQAIKSYIRNYQEYFLSRFSDTGMWWEEVIQQNYIQEATALRDNLYRHISTAMKRDLIGYESSEGDIRTTATFLERRILFIEYREDTENKIRYILSLKIVYR